MKKCLFEGSGVAIVTPFTETGIDFDKMGELIEYHIARKTDAIIVCGTTGEAATMPDEEHMSLISYTVKKAGGRIPVIAGTGSNDTAHAIKLSQFAESAGADGILTVSPYYNKTTQKGLMAHFGAIAESIKIPIMLYNIPGRTGVNIAPQTLLALAEKYENIVAVKEANPSMAQAMETARLCGEKLAIYSGNDDLVVPLMSIGAKGVVSVVANIMPDETHDMVMSYLEGDTGRSLELQMQMAELISALFIEVNPIPVKAAMNQMGFGVGKLRLPLVEMEEKNLEVLKAAMKNIGLM